MSEPNTRPGEIARIAQLANGDPYRTEVLLLLVETRETSKRHEQWQASHEKLDNERHQNLVEDITAIRIGLGGAVSGVGDYKADRYRFDGARLAAYAIIGAIVSLIGLVFMAGWRPFT